MARRKRMLDDDSSDSSQSEIDIDLDNDPDAREERALFDDPYQRKRRKKNGKEDALYGVFGGDSEEDTPKEKSSGKQKKNDWAKAPAFVSGEKKVDLDKEMELDLNAMSDDNAAADGEDTGSEGEDSEAGEDEEFSDDSEPSRPPSPRIREDDEEEEPRPSMGGIGSGASKATATSHSFSKGGISSSKSGIGSSSRSANQPLSAIANGGIGSLNALSASKGGVGSRPSTSASTSQVTEELPAAFGSRNQRSFVRDANPPKPAAPLSTAELAHFNKLQGSFGARMLAKMGWQAGAGLGTDGEGIVTPVESKLRPQKMGIAFKGFREKTEQSKLEAKRRGEVVSDDEDAKTKKFKRKVKEQAEKRSDVWKRPKKVKTKVEHKTYEQIVAEAGQDTPAAGIGQIIDATGAVVRPFYFPCCHHLTSKIAS
jgi:tuftelin-interacting protein 11